MIKTTKEEVKSIIIMLKNQVKEEVDAVKAAAEKYKMQIRIDEEHHFKKLLEIYYNDLYSIGSFSAYDKIDHITDVLYKQIINDKYNKLQDLRIISLDDRQDSTKIIKAKLEKRELYKYKNFGAITVIKEYLNGNIEFKVEKFEELKDLYFFTNETTDKIIDAIDNIYYMVYINRPKDFKIYNFIHNIIKDQNLGYTEQYNINRIERFLKQIDKANKKAGAK